jgi:hypothetical protein
MYERRLRVVRPLSCASEAQLILGLTERNPQALHELSQRHAAALSVLACAIVQPASARQAVAAVFAAVWAAPDQLGADDSVRAQLAGMVYEECCATEVARADGPLDAAPGTSRRAAARPERVAVALIAFGDHTCEHAAARVGLRSGFVAERLRAFVLDPNRFTAFSSTNENLVALRAARQRR